MKALAKNLILSLLPTLLIASPAFAAAAPVARPPQFVLISFDNCQELQTWKQVSALLDQLSASAETQIHFTFFLSAVGLLPVKDKNLYENPSSLAALDPSRFPEKVRRESRGRSWGDRGESNIGFGGDELTVAERVAFINRMYHAGNEIASHGVGHFDGSKWDQGMWKQELDQFDSIVDRLAGSAPTDVKAKLDFTSRDIYSFRAPYLGGNADLVRELSARGYTADASDINANYSRDQWPNRYSVKGKNDGPWDIGLTWTDADHRYSNAEDPKTDHLPAMDYNYCVHQTTDGCSLTDRGNTLDAQTDAQNMLKAYTDAFTRSYNGNRAPVVIGHHFFPYRDGIYNAALAKFALTACHQAETRCVTFQELRAYLDQLDPATRAQYQAGNFPKAPAPLAPAKLLGNQL